VLRQFLTDVYWGELDYLPMDLPPGTGDLVISVAQLVPKAEILGVTTPRPALTEVAERAGSIALQTRQRIVGVVEYTSYRRAHTAEAVDVHGSGGGEELLARSSTSSSASPAASPARPRAWAPPPAPPELAPAEPGSTASIYGLGHRRSAGLRAL